MVKIVEILNTKEKMVLKKWYKCGSSKYQQIHGFKKMVENVEVQNTKEITAKQMVKHKEVVNTKENMAGKW